MSKQTFHLPTWRRKPTADEAAPDIADSELVPSESAARPTRRKHGKRTYVIGGALLALAICLVVTLLLIVFFKTHVGLCIRATGDNQDMVRASSINVDATLILGLCISNGLIGLAGALVTHYVGYSDTSTSNGTLIYGLAAVIIGEALFGKRGVTVGLISAVCGSVIYKLIVTFVVDIELFGTNSANLMKLMCAVIVAATFIIPAAKRTARNRKVKKEARRNA